ncbi:autophagy-type protein 22 [Vararia minispora EC-137]|uniref:Autophagy-type protein 22 n=1 Tax=Vararia minispora EC-137 TaxID=1314806 RepID=A0ACB8QBJ4_9AGAM|nr:autophagy-type protein 22 [Vararia minispora EC-137]
MSGDSLFTSAKRHRRELFGWLSYAFASEVFVIVSLTLFLPICLEQFARDNGYLLPDKTIPCNAPQPQDEEEKRCVVKLGWLWIDSASFSLYAFSASVALQALTVISMGGIADHPPHRKRLLLGFAVLGSTSAILFFFLSSSSLLWPVAGLLVMAANVGFGASVVAMNAYLPYLARTAPEVVAARVALDAALADADASASASHHTGASPDPNASLDADVGAPLLPSSVDIPSPATDCKEVAELRAIHSAAYARTTARISAHGIALGYASGITLLLLTVLPVTRAGGSTFALRCAIGASGVWWAIFSVVAGVLLPSAASDRKSSYETESEEEWNSLHEIVRAWRRLGQMLHPREIRRLGQTFRYLAAWFILSDGFTTISSTAVLFGKTTLRLPASILILVGGLAPAFGVLGALVWPMLQKRMGWSNLMTMTVLLALALAIPSYGLLGLIPAVRRAGFGLVSASEMLIVSSYFGFVGGAFQSYARAVYATLIPPGEEARWFALFSITDKSSSFIGPLLVGLIADATGNIRFAFVFLVAVFLLALPILAGVDVEGGGEDARKYALIEEEIRKRI